MEAIIVRCKKVSISQRRLTMPPRPHSDYATTHCVELIAIKYFYLRTIRHLISHSVTDNNKSLSLNIKNRKSTNSDGNQPPNIQNV